MSTKRRPRPTRSVVNSYHLEFVRSHQQDRRRRLRYFRALPFGESRPPIRSTHMTRGLGPISRRGFLCRTKTFALNSQHPVRPLSSFFLLQSPLLPLFIKARSKDNDDELALLLCRAISSILPSIDQRRRCWPCCVPNRQPRKKLVSVQALPLLPPPLQQRPLPWLLF